MFFSMEGRGAHTVFSLFHVPEKISALTTVQKHQSMCYAVWRTSLSFIFLFCLFTRVLHSTAARVHQSHTKVIGRLKKITPSFQRAPEINAENLNRMGFGSLFLFQVLILHLVSTYLLGSSFCYKIHTKTHCKGC